MKMNKRGFTLIELLVVLVLLGAVATAVIAGLGNFSISDGKRVGVVTKFSHKGIFCKTWEGDLLLGGQGTVTSSHWEFSVDDKNVAEEINGAMDKQELVELLYHQQLFVFPWKGDTKYFVTGVKQIHRPATAVVNVSPQ